jgi:hypothetical protein
MNSADPDHALHTTPALPPSDAAAPQLGRTPAPRSRMAGLLLVIACLLAVGGAALPWVTTVDVNLALGTIVRRLTWHVWDTIWVVFYFPLLALPLIALGRTGLAALRGRPFRRTRGAAVRLSLVGLVGTVLVGAVTAFDAALSGGFGWGRTAFHTDVFIEGGLPASLGSWVLALIASVLVPAKRGR